MTKLDNILAMALADRGLLPHVFACGCCGDTLHRDDHMADNFTEEHTEAVRIAYGPDVCFACADAFEPASEWTDEDYIARQQEDRDALREDR